MKSGGDQRERVRLLIDTDVALGIEHEGRPRDIDDGFAIVEALNSERIDLAGITTVYGNASQASVYQVANDIVALKRSTVPVRPGAVDPLPQSGSMPPTNEAVEFLAESLREAPAHLAAIGPLTNIGLLAFYHPELLDRVQSLIMVAGRSEDSPFYIGEAGPIQDFNFEHDVRAARLVLESEVTKILMGFELTSQVAVTESDLHSIHQVGTDTAEYFYRNSLAWCRWWTREFPADAGFHPWDSAAIAWIQHPEYFRHQPRGWRIREPDKENHWLECDPEYPGGTVTYCTGFVDGASAAFVRDLVAAVY